VAHSRTVSRDIDRRMEVKFLNPENLAEALKELAPIEQILYCDALLCTRIINVENNLEEGEDDEMADYIRDMMDEPWYKLEEEERERLKRFFGKADKARHE